MGSAEMGLAGGIRFARAQCDSISQCAATGSNVHRPTAGIVQRR
jgi:hypothetical protein